MNPVHPIESEKENFCPVFCIFNFKEWNDANCEKFNFYICEYEI